MNIFKELSEDLKNVGYQLCQDINLFRAKICCLRWFKSDMGST